MSLPDIIFALLVQSANPGATRYSVEPADYCMIAFPPYTCAVRTNYSTFYNGWIHQERRETALIRYQTIVRELDAAARELLCIDGNDRPIESCEPYRGLYGFSVPRYWSLVTLETAGAAIGLIESGYREDVQVGRGKNGKPSDDGGEGRGSGGEACFIQAHPSTAWRFADGPDASTLEAARNGSTEAREAVAATLLGRAPERLRACWRVGLRMLIHSRSYCQWWLGANDVRQDGDFAMFSMYGTGTSCVSTNEGKTMTRVRQFRSFYEQARAALSK